MGKWRRFKASSSPSTEGGACWVPLLMGIPIGSSRARQKRIPNGYPISYRMTQMFTPQQRIAV